MFDHLGISATSLAQSRPFYRHCLAALGIDLLEDHGDGAWLVFGTDAPAPFFVVTEAAPSFWEGHHRPAASPTHLAFQAASLEAVDAFHAAGLMHGGRDHGAPGWRDPGYYAAYLLDPDGHNIEAGFRRG